MKIAINKCYGGFSLSPAAVKELARLKGRECYFYSYDLKTHKMTPISLEEAEKAFIFFSYDVPNIDEVAPALVNWGEHPVEVRQAHNQLIETHSLDKGRSIDRADPDLIKVIESLGEKANGSHAKLEIVEIPDGTDWEVEEYDGREWIAEKHATWS